MDVNSLFSRAEQAFVAGQLDEAKKVLRQVQRAAGDHPAVLHLLALVEKKRGAFEESRRAFSRALAVAPADPQINNNFGNLLNDLGELEAALRHFDRALAAAPRLSDACFNRALLLQRMGRLEDALAELDRLALTPPPQAKVHSARGIVLREMGRIEEAAAAFDKSLELQPQRLNALHGRARIAMERGEPSASVLYRQALEQSPDDLELQLGFAEATEAEGGPSAVPILANAVKRHPEWIYGYEQLARMRSEAGAGESFADAYAEALRERPLDRALLYSYCRTLARAGLNERALAEIEQAKIRFSEDPEMILLEAVLQGEIGEADKARVLLDRLEDTPDIRLARARHALQAGEYSHAATLFERAVEEAPQDIFAWAHLSLAWRLTGDPRNEWLCGQEGFYGTRDIGIGHQRLEEIATYLRGLHRTRAHPIGQSLRGGTQTRGSLFLRMEPEAAELRQAIQVAVAAHFKALPAFDSTHPLLRHRDTDFRFSGSWSVRLSECGFHVNHIHPQGILSSACYICLPESLGSADTKDGWLDIGAPPKELKLDLPPLASIEPKPGRLALFPSYLFHGTRPFRSGERLTVAFDVTAAR